MKKREKKGTKYDKIFARWCCVGGNVHIGWFVKIRLENHDEVENLMDNVEYAVYCDDSEKDA